MLVTKETLNQVIFENHDAKLLIEDIVTNTDASVYYYAGTEFTLERALKLWHKADKISLAIKTPIKRYQTHQNCRTWLFNTSVQTLGVIIKWDKQADYAFLIPFYVRLFFNPFT